MVSIFSPSGLDNKILENIMKKKDLSVIIVNYKSWELLQNCLNSFKQFPPKLTYEIIVVDNDSQDEKFEGFSKLHPNIKFLKNKGNYGFSNGCNLGAENSNGEFLLFLNPDTELTKDNAVDAMVNFLKENSDVGIASCRTITAKKIERELLFSNPWLLIAFVRQVYKLINRKSIKKQFPDDADVWYPDWVSGAVVLISSTLFEQVGRWRQDRYWMYHEDPDLCIKVKKAGKKTALLRNVIIKHVGGGTSRKNSETTIMAKTEVIISSHNYIQVNTKKLVPILHFLFAVISVVSLLVKAIFSLLFLQLYKTKVYFFTAFSVIKYYVSAVSRGTWKSQKLDNQSH